MNSWQNASDAGRTASRFRTTQWTLIGRACHDGAALNALLETYWSPVYAFFRRSGFQGPDAEDLTQAFLAQQAQRLFEDADRARGSFRAYLKRALKNFAIDEHRRKRGRHGEKPRMIAAGDPVILERIEAGGTTDPLQAYDHEFAAVILDEAIWRTRAECEAERRMAHWRAYEMVRLDPNRSGNAPPSLETVAQAVGVERPEDVSMMLHSVKRKIQRQLAAVVDETVADAHDTTAELIEIRELLRRV